MSKVSIRQVGKQYGNNISVIQNLNLEIADGEFMVFVGPSGCGKTTLLRMIAGLEDISQGDILFGDERVNDVDPADRGAAMVFQSYALYPHMTVAENMGFSLKLAGASKEAQRMAVSQVAEILQITALLDRKPKALSGGQRQRVAIGRAIVRKPKVFLFDEPLSNLDANLRVQMRVELTRLHRELGTTMIYVTHDQVEAMTLGQRIAVFNAGRIEQVGTPLELYHSPANRFVAEFIGSPRMNLLPARLNEQGAAAVLEAGVWALPASGSTDRSTLQTVGVRPEDLFLEGEGALGTVRAEVNLIEQLGDATIVHLQVSGLQASVAARLNGSVHHWAVGQIVGLRCAPEKLRCFDIQGRALV
jgi:multiple sugar transport system ATP-binding protein